MWWIIISIVILWVGIPFFVGNRLGKWTLTSEVIAVTERETVQPNYYYIADMERPIWGQTFHSAQSANQCRCDVCTQYHPIYTDKELVRPPHVECHHKLDDTCNINEPWRDRYGA
jgi:ribosomal protein L31